MRHPSGLDYFTSKVTVSVAPSVSVPTFLAAEKIYEPGFNVNVPT